MNFKILVILIIYLNFNESTLTPKSPKSKKKEKKDDEPTVVGPQDENVFDKNLVIDPPSVKDILTHYNAYSRDRSKFRTKKALGYVTPWNNKGYDAAYLFANKFTHISPVWLQVRKVTDGVYEVTGLHDVDKTWMQDVKDAGKDRNLKFVPRVFFENWTAQDFMTLVTSEKEFAALAEELISVCKKYKFDGFVLELWSQFVGRVQNELLVNLIQEISIRLRKKGYEVILVIPPMRSESPLFDRQLFNDLYEHVDGFSLMTYDFSSVHRPGPNAPIKWIEDCVKLLAPTEEKREKIFTGLNFYGYDYTPSGGGALLGSDYIKILNSYKGKFQKDEKSDEHFFEIKDCTRNFSCNFTMHSNGDANVCLIFSFRKKNRRLNNMQMVNKNLDPEVFTSEGSKSHAEHGFFRKLSVLSTKSSGITSKLNNNLNYAKRERRGSKDELMDSMDDSNSFDYAVLHVDNTDMDNFCIDLSDESDETISCLSDESKFTAYSTFTLTRGSSFAETLKSALSYSDIDKF